MKKNWQKKNMNMNLCTTRSLFPWCIKLRLQIDFSDFVAFLVFLFLVNSEKFSHRTNLFFFHILCVQVRFIRKIPNQMNDKTFKGLTVAFFIRSDGRFSKKKKQHLVKQHFNQCQSKKNRQGNEKFQMHGFCVGVLMMVCGKWVRPK